MLVDWALEPLEEPARWAREADRAIMGLAQRQGIACVRVAMSGGGSLEGLVGRAVDEAREQGLEGAAVALIALAHRPIEPLPRELVAAVRRLRLAVTLILAIDPNDAGVLVETAVASREWATRLTSPTELTREEAIACARGFLEEWAWRADG